MQLTEAALELLLERNKKQLQLQAKFSGFEVTEEQPLATTDQMTEFFEALARKGEKPWLQ